ncbi:MAG: hypothetical protein HYV47_02660 [Candidatus Nealsonbacteria bacterium]|nr:hypothetical protein [Candidatus Nealsonbacteria bacterium]
MLNVKMQKGHVYLPAGMACRQAGVSIYLAVVIMAAILAIAFGISTIFLGQVEVNRSMGYSVIAFYAADAGIERILMNRANPSNIAQTSLSNGATYQVFVTARGGSCAAQNYCIKSIGKYKGAGRAIEITY